MKYLTVTLFLLYAVTANSQTKLCQKYSRPTDRDSIIKIEREQYFNDANFLYLCKDMYLDSFLSFDQYYGQKPFSLKYKKGELSLNGADFPKEYSNKYVTSIKLLMNRLSVPDSLQDIKITTDRIKRNIDVKEHNNLLVMQEQEVYRGCRPRLYSTTVTRNETAIKMPAGALVNDSILLHTISADKYVSKPCQVKVRCNSNACWINDKPLSDTESRKYAVLVQRITGIKPKSDKDFTGVSYSREDFVRFLVKL